MMLQIVRKASGIAIEERIIKCLRHVCLLPRWMMIECREVRLTVSMLRGVWGLALHELDREVYYRVFNPSQRPVEPAEATEQKRAARAERPPGYLLRPAAPDPSFSPALEWVLLGDAIRDDEVLLRAWDIACGMGVGKRRDRFYIRKRVVLGPDDRPAPTARAWALSEAAWPLAGDPATTPCRLTFPGPIRMHGFDRACRKSTLITEPTLADLIVAICRRLAALLPPEHQSDWEDIRTTALATARSVRTGPWKGGRLDLRRYSGSQRIELELRGVSGCLDLPRGPGSLWPLLAAAQWTHLGKATVVGMGQLCVITY